MFSRYFWCILAVALAPFLPVSAQETVRCKVLDPELQERYEGGCKGGLADGEGEASGLAHYKGTFRGGHKHGRGVKQWPSGNRYEGDFVNDVREGTGTFIWGRGTQWAGEKFAGEYRNDRRHGSGIYEWPDGDRYAGTWDNDAISGQPTTKMYERSRAYMEHASAVGIPGIKVCKNVTFGISTQTWLRGVVTAVAGPQISVRIDALGNTGQLTSGPPLKPGDVIWDPLVNWTPCL